MPLCNFEKEEESQHLRQWTGRSEHFAKFPRWCILKCTRIYKFLLIKVSSVLIHFNHSFVLVLQTTFSKSFLWPAFISSVQNVHCSTTKSVSIRFLSRSCGPRSFYQFNMHVNCSTTNSCVKSKSKVSDFAIKRF